MIQPEEAFKTMAQGLARASEGAEIRPVIWTVEEGLPYFRGHFPGSPILPAIAIIDASTFLLQRLLDRPKLKISCVSNAKFVSPIQPGQTVRIEFDRVDEGDWEIEWKDHTNGARLASLRIRARS